MTKELSHMMLELHNVKIELSNVIKKVWEPLNVTKELSYVMLELHNMRMEPSSVRKKKGTTQCDKRIVACNVETAQCEDKIVKYEKKKSKGTTKCEKKLSHVMLELHNVRMKPLNMRKK